MIGFPRVKFCSSLLYVDEEEEKEEEEEEGDEDEEEVGDQWRKWWRDLLGSGCSD